jgi:hypothetical protein
MQNLSHSESLQTCEKIAPSKSGIKHLAFRIAEGKSGSALKDIHYAEQEYASTPYGAPIPSIKGRVLARLKTLKTGA